MNLKISLSTLHPFCIREQYEIAKKANIGRI